MKVVLNIVICPLDLRSKMVPGRPLPGVWWQRQFAQHLADCCGPALLAAQLSLLIQVSNDLLLANQLLRVSSKALQDR